MPASTIALTSCCSQTRSATHIPRTWAPKSSLKIGGECLDLTDAIPLGDHGQDRLEEPAAQDLDPARLDQGAEAGDVVGMPVDQPFQERPGGVQHERYFRIAFEHVEKRLIAGAIGLLEDPVEITHGLVVMQRENQANLRHVRPLRGNDGDRDQQRRGLQCPVLRANDREFPVGGPALRRAGRPLLAARDVDLTQETGRVLGRNRVDVKARTPLETRDLGQPRNHLDVPMVMR